MIQRYDSYKPSGIDWIGEIPSHWKLIRMRYLCDMITGDKDTVNKVDDGQYPFYVRSPHIERINSYTFDGEAVLMAGDGVGAGKVVHYANGKFDFHQRVYNFHNFKEIKGVLLYQYLKTLFKYKIEEGGAKNTVDSVRQPWLKDFPICVPPIKEQEAIAAWLDEKCGEIDTAIAKVDREIELIDELKQSEISRVVTRGLNPDAPLRPSGIDWIGDVPAHWKISKLKYCLTELSSGGTPKADENRFYSDDGIPWVAISDMSNNDFVNTTTKCITEEGRADKNLKIYPAGTILYSIYATLGKVSELNVSATINQAILAMCFNNETDKKYIKNFLKSMEAYVISLSTSNTQANLNAEKVKNLSICLPPLPEQQSIADYLDKKCAEIDGLKEKLVKKRETLKELRQAIISEVVTGKRKVV